MAEKYLPWKLMSSFCEKRSGSPLKHQDALRLETDLKGEEKRRIHSQSKSIKETLCV